MIEKDKVFFLLDKIEAMLDPEFEQEKLNKHISVLNCDGEKPPIRVPLSSYPSYTIEEIHNNKYKMLYNELLPIYNSLRIKDDALPMIRANFGVGTFTSIYNFKSKIIGNNMPWVEPKSLDTTIDSVFGSLNYELIDKIIEIQDFYLEILSKYEKAQKYIKIYHCDLQGPLDNLHLMIGSDIYYMMYDDESTLYKLLDKISQDYVDVLNKVRQNTTDKEGDYLYHWYTLYCGNAVLRVDTATNLSNEMYHKFSGQFDEKIGKKLGKISLHYCGKYVSWLNDIFASENIKALNIGTVPSFDYDVNFIQEITDGLLKYNKPLVNMRIKPKYLNDQSLIDIIAKNKNFSFIVIPHSEAEAIEIMEKYKEGFGIK
ncbi:MAG: hypothetical protein PHX62_07760 [Bacilli bacterium]|nr:hypothetical protein [Bacilli bacterium]